MATYRIFMLGDDDHIVDGNIIDCSTDDEALTRAPSLAGDHKGVEVWELRRCVGRIDLRHPVNE